MRPAQVEEAGCNKLARLSRGGQVDGEGCRKKSKQFGTEDQLIDILAREWLSEDQIHDHPYALKGANDCSDGDRSVEPEGEEDGNTKEDSPSMGQNKLKEVALRLHLREDAPQEEALGEVDKDEMDFKGQDKLQV